MAAAAKPISFLVPGEPDTSSTRSAVSTATSRGQVRHSVRVGTSRGEAAPVAVHAVPGQDVVVLHIADGPELVLHPENARDLLQAQSGPAQRAGRAPATARDGVVVPVRLQWSGLTDVPTARGSARGVGGVLLSKLEVITPVLQDTAAGLVATEIVRRVDAQVDAGVYQLSPDALPPLKGKAKASNLSTAADGSPILVLVHGTFSTTAGTFSQLWVQHPDQVRSLFKNYGGRVYGLDHPTLGASPIDNALMLARALPPGARVHLLTHSRGGLVAEVLARICADPDDDFTEFAGKEYRGQKTQLQALAAVVKKNKLKVERVVRVACPARGTLLASKRVDAFVSVFKWTLELAGLPVAAEILDFLNAVAQKRTDPALIPGLAAQVPDSALIRWLHSVDRQVDGQLRVIAGDLQGDSISSWLKTLLTDAFYWTDHDLVVQTRSMYGGSPRQAASTFVLDQGGKVTHFNYFSNDRTARALTNALLQEAPQEFSVIGPLSWAGESATGARARISRSTTSAAASRPAVFILPGILGSNLKVGGNRVWVSWRLVNGLKQLTFTGKADKVEPDGLVGSVYDNLAAFLSSTHEVIQFPFDWRRPIEDEARRLAASVSAALDARARSLAPVRLVAHSMGGLVARTMQLETPRVWTRMLAQEGARLLMLGTPNAGSFAPMQVLSGDDTFGNLLALVGAPFQNHDARSQMAAFPGFIQLQAGLIDGEQPLSSARAWQKLADDDWQRAREHQSWHQLPIQLDALRWGVPPQKVLDAAVALRRRLDAQAPRLEEFTEHLALVVGSAPFTPSGYAMQDAGLVYTGNASGDGRVTLEQALLPGVRTWRIPCDHSNLPGRKDAFTAYLELLEKGATTLIESVPDRPSTRGTAATLEVYSRPSRAPQKGTPPRVERQALEPAAVGPAIEASGAQPALRVTVQNGDLTYLRQPLIIGHYRSMRLTGTEQIVDRLLGHTMEQSLRVGTYPDTVGTNRLFANLSPSAHQDMPRGPGAAIVIGLGEESKLRGADLVRAVRQGVLAWAQRQAEQHRQDNSEFELAATLIGSGGSGVSAGQSAQLVAQGVFEANERLAAERAASGESDRGSHALGHVSRLILNELYLDRASEALRALQLQAQAAPGRFLVDPVVAVGTGGLERPVDASYRGADYDFITALTRVAPEGNAIEYTLDTKRARTEVRAQHAQSELLRHLVALASNDASTDTRIGRTLFQLLVPIEIEPYLAGSSEMQIEVDRGTAGIPWELLDTDADASPNSVRSRAGSEPWAVRARLLRKLRVENPPERPDAGTDGSALVIGEPKCDPDKYPRLIGARAEARQVADCLSAASALGGDRVEGLISPDDPQQFGADARQVLNALFDRDRTWRIIHIAGHGEPATDTEQGGVVLSDGFLSATEISAMRKTPELVFVNCCYLAARSPNQLLRSDYDRVRFAAGVAEELIRIGVRCVIAAGWAVDDEAASAFATTFYRSLLGGRRFLDAVSDARRAALTLGGNTWAAYQCYGDPDWMFRRDTPDAQRPSLDDQFQGVLSAASLARALTTLVVQSEFQGARPEIQRDRIRFLEDKARRAAPEWLRSGLVAEAFGHASAAAGDIDAAVRWYAQAVRAADGTASLKAVMRLEELRGTSATRPTPKKKRPARRRTRV